MPSKATIQAVLSRLEEIENNSRIHREYATQKMEDIHKQTTTTNGRVTTLEHWRAKMSGMWFVVLILVSVLGTGGGIYATVYAVGVEEKAEATKIRMDQFQQYIIQKRLEERRQPVEQVEPRN